MLQSGRTHSDEQVQKLTSAYLVFRSGYSKLNAAALEEGLCRWPMRPKHHYCEHWIFDILPLHARYMHNVLSEDMLRRVKLIASKSLPAFKQTRLLQVYPADMPSVTLCRPAGSGAQRLQNPLIKE